VFASDRTEQIPFGIAGDVIQFAGALAGYISGRTVGTRVQQLAGLHVVGVEDDRLLFRIGPAAVPP